MTTWANAVSGILTGISLCNEWNPSSLGMEVGILKSKLLEKAGFHFFFNKKEGKVGRGRKKDINNREKSQRRNLINHT